MKPVDEILKSLTLRQKVDLLSGQNAWKTYDLASVGVPSILMTDGPHGLRKQYNEKAATFEASVPATCFPAAATLSCSYDPDLVYEVGHAIGEEARDQDIQLILGPGINIKRSPLCGRNFEYFSEDPLLSGVYGAALIQGLQSTGVGACLKHFACNNREYFRMVANSIVDDRALNEIYLRGFEHAVKEAQPYAVMSAYNLLNNEYCGENTDLLSSTLRDTWGFDGIVISDWGACYNRVASVQAGMDLEMPYSGQENTERVLKALRHGNLDTAAVNTCVRRLVTFIKRCEDGKQIPWVCSYPDHHDLARRAARESAVLLKNRDAALPLAEGQKIALIGAFAVEPRYQGAGSSMIVPKKLENAYDVFPEYGLPFEYAQGYALNSLEERTSGELREAAVAIAKKHGTAVIIAGLPASMEFEGVDRENLEMPLDQTELIEAVSKVAKTIVVLCCGAPVEMPWIEAPDAVLHCYLGGEAGASAAAELLTGRANPSGRLAESYPFKLDDTPARRFFRDARHNVEYRESVYVGYRFYEAANKDVLFPFGFGLSYTTFEWSDFDVVTTENGVTASLTVKNTDTRTGADVVQVYAQGRNQPYAQLAGFAKISLEPGESQHVSIPLDAHSFEFYQNGWHRQNCTVSFGRHAGDCLWSKDLTFPDAQEAPVYAVAADGQWPRDTFEALFNTVPSMFIVARPFTLNATLADLRQAPAGEAINNAVLKYGSGLVGFGEPPEFKIIARKYLEQNPMRALVSLSGGLFSYGMASAILMMANGNYLVGIARLVIEFRRSQKRIDPKRLKKAVEQFPPG